MQFALGLGAQLAYLGVHSLGVSEVFILSELFLREGTSLRPGLKPGEKESVCAVIEKLVLSLARILVHGFSDNGEVWRIRVVRFGWLAR